MADKELVEPSARTLRLLMSWEKKYGLDVIRHHLDEGLFSRDKEEQRRCYEWLARRKLAKRNNAIVELVIGVAVVITAGIWVMSAY